MKRCSYCGKEYPDHVTVCPLDGQSLESKGTRGRSAPPTESRKNAFDVKLVSPLLAAGTYRVFVERSDLIFIRLQGGSRSIIDAAAPLLGPFGGLIPIISWLFKAGKAKAERQRVETDDPEILLRENRNNFKLHQAEIREATIEAPPLISTSGKAGRLNLLVRHGEKFRCEFENAGEMKRAIQLLIPLLNSTLRVSAEWNEEKQRFEARKKHLTH